MKKVLVGLTLLLGSVFCFSCGARDIGIGHIDIDEPVEPVKPDPTPVIPAPSPKEITGEELFMQHYDTFYANYEKQGTKHGKVKVSGNIKGKDIDLSFNNNEFTLTCYKNVVSINFTYTVSEETKTFNMKLAGLERDIVNAYLESFIMRGHECKFTMAENYIVCDGMLKDQKDIDTKIAYNSLGYLTRYKGLMFNYSSEIGDIETAATCDLTFTDWTK